MTTFALPTIISVLTIKQVVKKFSTSVEPNGSFPWSKQPDIRHCSEIFMA